MRRVRLLGVVLATSFASLAVGAPPGVAATEEYSGTVLSCSYTLKADTVEHSFSAALSACGGSLDPEGELDGSWKSNEVEGSTDVTLETAKLSILGEERSFTVAYTFSLPVDVDGLIVTYEHLKKLREEGKATLKEVEEAKEHIKQQFAAALKELESDVIVLGAEGLAKQLGDGVPEAAEHLNEMTRTLQTKCEESGTDFSNPFCSPYSPTGPYCKENCPVPASANEGALPEGTGEDAGESESDQRELCPVFNSVQEDAVFVCVPSFVTGNIDTGDKPLVILAGGALLMVPGVSGESKIESKAAIVQLGGALFGDNLALKAPGIAMAGGFQNAIGTLTLDGGKVSIGQVDGETLLAAVPELPRSDWLPEIFEKGLLHTKINVPDVLSARHTTIKAGESLLLANGSKILGAGLGGHGGDFETGIDPTGETERYGGSHGGLGGYTVTSFGTQGYDEWNTMAGRSPVTDDPFHPTAAGDGGGAEAGGALGLPGGGTVQVLAPEAEVEIDGKIDVSGYGSGLADAFSNGDHGGSGAGGSVYLTAEKLAGSGTVDADGGSHCNERRHIEECVNGGGGSGGGGRIAALYESDSGWSGSLEAHGGIDEEWEGSSEEQFLGSGGAGTVFTRTVEFSEAGEVEKGTGAFPEGTLTIDGGRAPGAYPAPDGTPLQDSWSGANRKLVVEGEARAYGHELNYGAIELLHGGVLTSGISKAGTPIPQTLKVKAGSLLIDATSRLQMTGRGEAGGEAETALGTGGAAAGQSASTKGHGGSHAGAGGATGAKPEAGAVSGSTYDNAEDPTLPGGGGAGFGTGEGNAGGGVLDVEASKLVLEGAIVADGQSGDGPTAVDPVPFDFQGGGGAGGSVLVRSAELSGAGRISADGGDTCIATAPPLLAGVTGCNSPTGSGGGGGGGRVALLVGALCEWHGTLSAAGGADSQSELAAEPEDALARRGGAGSVFFPTPAGTCTKEEPKVEEPRAKGGETPPPPREEPKPPSNAFSIVAHRAVARTGAEILTIEVPGPGSLVGVETAALRSGAHHRAAKPDRVGGARATATAKGRLKMTFALSAPAKAYLRRHGRLVVTLRVTYTPTGGTARVRTLTLTIRKP